MWTLNGYTMLYIDCTTKNIQRKGAVRKGVAHAFLHKQTKVLHTYLNELSM
jgi:hypothetical protein